MFQLSSQSLEKIIAFNKMSSPSAGAFCAFEGWVRNHHQGKKVIALEYEAHEKLCITEANKILAEAKKTFDVFDARIIHRVGRLKVGDMAVWIGVTASHRDHAFKACRFLIDEIKKSLPIWKKEIYANGDSGWVNCDVDHSVVIASEVKQFNNEGLPRSLREHAMTQSQYYARQTILPEIGKSGQARLKKSKVLVVGAGGLGCPALLTLAGAGVGTIGIVEHDVLDVTNLHRQHLYQASDVGKKKIELASERLKSSNPFIKIVQHSYKLEVANVLKTIKPYDIVLDCTDNFAAKFLLNDACFLAKKVLIQASIYKFEGELKVNIPGQTGCLRCQWPTMPEDNCVGNCAEVGVLGVVPSLLGNLQAMEVIKNICGLQDQLKNQTLIVDCLSFETKRIKRVISPLCPLCGKQSKINSIDHKNYTSGKDYLISLKDTLIQDFQKSILIDVREQDELKSKSLKGLKTLHYPISQLNKNGFSFLPNQTYYVFCAKGGRSKRFVEHYRAKGFKNIFSVGGINDVIKMVSRI